MARPTATPTSASAHGTTTFTQYQQSVDQRFHATDRRINTIGAMRGSFSGGERSVNAGAGFSW